MTALVGGCAFQVVLGALQSGQRGRHVWLINRPNDSHSVVATAVIGNAGIDLGNCLIR